MKTLLFILLASVALAQSGPTSVGGGLPVATQAEAEAGTANNKTMTPLRTAQAIAALGGGGGSVETVSGIAPDGSGNVDLSGVYSAKPTIASLSTLALALGPREWPVKTDTWSTDKAITFTGGSSNALDGQVLVVSVTQQINLTVTPTSSTVYRNGSVSALAAPIVVNPGKPHVIRFWTPDNGTTLYMEDTINNTPLHFTFTFDPKAVANGDIDRLFLMTIGPDMPGGFVVTQWKLSFEADPTTEIDIDLKRADNFIGVANSAVMDVCDTTAGFAQETTAANINSGAIVANGKVLYLEMGTAYTEAGHQIIFELWGYAP